MKAHFSMFAAYIDQQPVTDRSLPLLLFAERRYPRVEVRMGHVEAVAVDRDDASRQQGLSFVDIQLRLEMSDQPNAASRAKSREKSVVIDLDRLRAPIGANENETGSQPAGENVMDWSRNSPDEPAAEQALGPEGDSLASPKVNNGGHECSSRLWLRGQSARAEWRS